MVLSLIGLAWINYILAQSEINKHDGESFDEIQKQ